MVAFKGHFDGRVVIPDEPLNLPAGQRVIVHVDADIEQTDGAVPELDPPREGESALEWMARHAVDDPSLPRDGSYQHDHYLYGTPKKP
ncbi:MAG: hypothetical protein WBD40_20600 [Tepidisphaeraceae bacterium]